ncbi:hypothetical protein RhiJN_17119 [Ceratobasidium sp. AG-Ba]|nr:hypothetical protein RhiJN_17119 [Ceratobasidium sp. AG-Ba]
MLRALTSTRPALSRRTACSVRVARLATEVQSSTRMQKAEGDISAVFPSLSGIAEAPLPPRFSDLKKTLVPTLEARDRLVAGWIDLLNDLREGVTELQSRGNQVIPEVSFAELERGNTSWHDEVRKRGSVVVRDVIEDSEALGWKQQVRDYVKSNPQVKGFPADNKQVFELYWSRPQVLARSHPNLLKASQALLSLFNAEPEDEVSLSTPISYADRLRIRLPGDAKFALGPHIDGGSLERWEDSEFRKCYREILAGNWRKFDPFKIGPRLKANSDLYHGASQCSVFRAFQGWVALSETGPNEGTLRTYPLLRESVAYVIMRPFFRPVHPHINIHDLLAPQNWTIDLDSTAFPGAVPGCGQELNAITHPHLMLDNGGMVSMKPVRPGDMVLWHCDGIHAVESKHAGHSDSSVFYIPAAPLTVRNAEYLVRQRETLAAGYPAPDFPGGDGEASFTGPERGRLSDVRGQLGKRAMGLHKVLEREATLLLALAFIKLRSQGRAPLPPSPPGLLIFGNAFEIRRAKSLWLKLAELAKIYGPIFTLRLPITPVIIVSDVETVTELFDKRSSNFANRPVLPMVQLSGWGDRLLHRALNCQATLDYQDIQLSEVKKLMKRLVDDPDNFLSHIHFMAGSISLRITYGYTPRGPRDKFIVASEEMMAAIREATTPGYWLVDTFPLLRFVPSWFPGAHFKRKTERWAQMTVEHRTAPFEYVLDSIVRILSIWVRLTRGGERDDKNYRLVFVRRWR